MPGHDRPTEETGQPNKCAGSCWTFICLTLLYFTLRDPIIITPRDIAAHKSGIHRSLRSLKSSSFSGAIDGHNRIQFELRSARVPWAPASITCARRGLRLAFLSSKGESHGTSLDPAGRIAHAPLARRSRRSGRNDDRRLQLGRMGAGEHR